MFNFKNKTVLVTGGNSGIGKSCALMFAKAGANVMIAARRKQESLAVIDEITANNGNACFVQTDMADSKSIKKMIDDTITKFGEIDFAINNAGIIGSTGLAFTNFTEKEYEQVMTVNVKGIFIAMQHQLRVMLKQSSGVIINMSSIAGLKAGRASPIYTASKHAVIGFTRSAAKEYADRGIRINAICPALVETPMVIDANFGNSKAISEGIPIGRLGRPEEVANAACWLCSDLSAYITGIALPIDGGIMA